MVKDCQHGNYKAGGDSGGGGNVLSRVLNGLQGKRRGLAELAPKVILHPKANFDSNDDTSSDDDDFEDVEYVSLEEVNEVDQEKEFDLDDILQIQDVILREKLLNVHRLISNIESLKDNPIPIMDSDSSITSLSFSNNSLPEFESFSDQTEETRSGNTTTHVNYSLPEFESFHFDLSFPDTPPEPPRSIPSHLPIRTFLPFSTYPRFLLYLVSPGCEDTSFDPGHLHLEQDYSDFEDSRALGFVPPFIRSFISCRLHLDPYPYLSINP
ncbi:hypothetical protein Tco_0636874 [Tanacetum coccineum]